MSKKFKHLRVPDHWEQYWSRYPQGYTILEALINWVSQVDDMVDNVNDWNTYLDDFVQTFDKKLQGTVTDILSDWQKDGTLEVIISDALDTAVKALGKRTDELEERLANFHGGTWKVFKVNKPGDVTTQLQEFFDQAEQGDTLIIPAGTYEISKNTALSGFPKNDQPCVLIRDKKDLHIVAYGANLKVNTHAQGALEIQQSENITIEGLITEGYGRFVPLDGNTGIGEKGNSEQGYHTSGFWNYNKNNSYDTSGDTRHGNNGQPWGMFGGGYIGNVGSGVLIQNACKNITLIRCESFGFNYSGFHVGHWGDDENYPTSEHIVFDNCYGHDNYSSNFASSKADGFKMVNCLSERAGHPDAKPLTDVQANPGYGITLAGGLHAMTNNAVIVNNTFRDNIRKGIDAHAGENIIIQGNQVYDSYYQGIFATWSSAIQSMKNAIIRDNIIERSGHKGGALFVRGRIDPEYSEENVKLNTIVSGNIIKKGGGGSNNGIFQATTFGNLTVTDNILEDVLDTYAGDIMNGFLIGSSLPSFALQMSNNKVIDKTGKIFVGMQISEVEEGIVSGNLVKLVSSRPGFGIYAIKNGDVNYTDNLASIAVGTPLNINQTRGNNVGNTGVGGTVDSLYGETKVQQLKAGQVKAMYPVQITNQQVVTVGVPNQFVGIVNDDSGRYIMFSSITKDTVVEIGTGVGFGLFSNTVLTGTTGDSGKINIGKKDGKLYFENYTGSNKKVALTIL